MRPGVGVDRTSGLLLDAVVTHGRGRIQRVRYVRLGQRLEVARIHGIGRPDPRVAIRLELCVHRGAVRSSATGAHLEFPEQVLDVVAVFMGDDISLREGPTLSAEARLELIEEGDVQIHDLVGRAVERARRARGCPAARVSGVLEQARHGHRVVATRGGELARPVGLDAVHESDHPAIVPGIGVGAGPTGLRQVGAAPRVTQGLADETAQGASVPSARETATEQQDGEDYDGAEAATAEGHATRPDPAPPGLLDLGGVQAGPRSEGHRPTVRRSAGPDARSRRMTIAMSLARMNERMTMNNIGAPPALLSTGRRASGRSWSR